MHYIQAAAPAIEQTRSSKPPSPYLLAEPHVRTHEHFCLPRTVRAAFFGRIPTSSDFVIVLQSNVANPEWQSKQGNWPQASLRSCLCSGSLPGTIEGSSLRTGFCAR